MIHVHPITVPWRSAHTSGVTASSTAAGATSTVVGRHIISARSIYICAVPGFTRRVVVPIRSFSVPLIAHSMADFDDPNVINYDFCEHAYSQARDLEKFN